MGSCFSRGTKAPHSRSHSHSAPLDRLAPSPPPPPSLLNDKQELMCERSGGVVEERGGLNGNTGGGVEEVVMGGCRGAHRLPSHSHSQGGTGGGEGGAKGSSEAKLARTVSDMKIAALFDCYRDPAEDSITAEGVERLCADLALSPDDFKVLLLAWKLDASQMCRFTREEFVSGCRSMAVDSLRAIQNKLPEIAHQVATNPDVFKDLYRFTFRFGLEEGGGQRVLGREMAAVLWRLVFTVREPPVLGAWLRYLSAPESAVRAVPRDTWNMFLNFSEAVGSDLSSYDDTEAWPTVFDDFVEFENDRANQNITKQGPR